MLNSDFNKTKYVYICYQAGNRSIMAVTDSETLAQKICSEHDDAYLKLELNKDYGRESINSDNLAIYNIKKNFQKLEERSK